MPQFALTPENNLRAVRILFAGIFFAILFLVYLAEMFFHHEARDVHTVWVGFLMLALSNAGLAFYFRIKLLQPAVETLQTSPNDKRALARWRFMNLLSFVLAESTVLLGFGLRFIGGTRLQSLPFYIIGIAVMLLWWPRRP